MPAGWRRTRATHGIILSLQIASNPEDICHDRMDRVDVALNERQLRSRARHLVRAIAQRDLQLFARRRWWRALLSHRRSIRQG